MATFELYRYWTIGMCLTDTLDEMVSSGSLSPELAVQVYNQFFRSMTEALETQVKRKITFKGQRLQTYRNCDDVWDLDLKNVVFKIDGCQEHVRRVKIVAYNSEMFKQ